MRRSDAGQAAMKLVEISAVSVQHQRPAGAKHHVREDQLAQRAAARREMDVHDAGLDGLERRAAASCTARANIAARANAEPCSIVATWRIDTYARQVIADVLLDGRDATAYIERGAELQHLDVARRNGGTHGRWRHRHRYRLRRGMDDGRHQIRGEQASGVMPCLRLRATRDTPRPSRPRRSGSGPRLRAACPICWRLRRSAYNAATSAGRRAASSVGLTPRNLRRHRRSFRAHRRCH